jgi:pantoate--beta-alanine ligase
MEVLETIDEIRRRLYAARRQGQWITLAPTMGALHEGHLELFRQAKQGVGTEGANAPPCVVASIFVNPTQFGPGEDYRAYPRDLWSDCEKAKQAGVEVIFAPRVEEMYPPGDTTFVEVGKLGEGLCGPFRPGHFRGVATVVCKLFNILLPDVAYFGEKDYQQLKIIERMAQDLHMPVKVVPVATVREADGLAMSSRNAYLSAAERQAAPALYKGLLAAQARAAKGEKNAAALLAEARTIIEKEPLFKIEYLELRQADTLETIESITGPAVLAVAARIGQARLIDNILIKVP